MRGAASGVGIFEAKSSGLLGKVERLAVGPQMRSCCSRQVLGRALDGKLMMLWFRSSQDHGCVTTNRC
jgi:hypothetical protein